MSSVAAFVQPATASNEFDRMMFLDGLRGAAALTVAFGHFSSLAPWPQDAEAWLGWAVSVPPLNLLTDGALAVSVFFVLSGFVLAESAARTRRPFSTLVMTRYLRLTAPMLISVLFSWALLSAFAGARAAFARHVPDSFVAHFLPGGVPSLGSAVFDAVAGVYVIGRTPINLVLWTMHYELIGSLALYFIYKVPARRHRLGLLALFALGALLSPNYLGFPLGAFFREAWAARLLRQSSWSWPALSLAILGTAVLWSVRNYRPFSPFQPGFFFANALFAALILYSVLTLPPLQRLLSAAWMVFLGRISFFFYLLHFPLIFSIIPCLALQARWLQGTEPYDLFLIYLALSLGLGWLGTCLVDEPLVRVLRLWGRQSVKRPVSDEPSAPAVG